MIGSNQRIRAQCCAACIACIFVCGWCCAALHGQDFGKDYFGEPSAPMPAPISMLPSLEQSPNGAGEAFLQETNQDPSVDAVDHNATVDESNDSGSWNGPPIRGIGRIDMTWRTNRWLDQKIPAIQSRAVRSKRLVQPTKFSATKPSIQQFRIRGENRKVVDQPSQTDSTKASMSKNLVDRLPSSIRIRSASLEVYDEAQWIDAANDRQNVDLDFVGVYLDQREIRKAEQWIKRVFGADRNSADQSAPQKTNVVDVTTGKNAGEIISELAPMFDNRFPIQLRSKTATSNTDSAKDQNALVIDMISDHSASYLRERQGDEVDPANVSLDSEPFFAEVTKSKAGLDDAINQLVQDQRGASDTSVERFADELKSASEESQNSAFIPTTNEGRVLARSQDSSWIWTLCVWGIAMLGIGIAIMVARPGE